MTIRHPQSGYTLAEMAIVLTIVSLVLGMTVSAGMTQMEIARNGSTKDTLETARQALLVYQKKRGHFPCPADPALLPTDANYGKEVLDVDGRCDQGGLPLTDVGEAIMGMLPFKDIKLNPEGAVDAWDRQITYAVDKDHTLDSHYQLGSLKVIDANGKEITGSLTLGDAIFVLISHGADTSGGYVKATGLRDTCTAGHKDTGNCDDLDDQFIDDRLNNNLDIPANFFDDIVVWQAQENLDIHNPITEDTDCDKPLAAGEDISCAVDSTGTPYCWGDNTLGGFGKGTSGDFSYTPVQAFGGGTDWTSFSTDISNASYGHSCGVRSNGTLYCAGSDGSGQLGNGVGGSSTTPVQESSLETRWLQVELGYRHSCGRQTSGRLYCWGNNSKGQLGDASSTNRINPREVSGTYLDWADVTLGSEHTCGIRNDGEAYCWGYNFYGQLGTGDNSDQDAPAIVTGGGSNWIAIDSNYNHTCALTQTGRAWCWGQGGNGRLGSGTSNQNSPVEVQNSYTDWTDISTGASSTCGIRDGGHLYCWGNRADYTIADGTGTFTGDALTPVEVEGLHDDWVKVSISAENGCGIRSGTGKFYCWGRNDHGQIGNGVNTPSDVPVEITAVSACDP